MWNAWKEVRRHLKRAPRRDVMDYLEYDIDPDVWINRLLRSLKNGDYAPEKPERYPLAKSKGFSRIITVPGVPDLVLYRTIVDHLFRKAGKKQRKHVYFCQSTLSKVVRQAGNDAREQIERYRDQGDYESVSKGAFLEWMKFEQYRRLLIFKKLHPFIVLTDITNFFDSLLYGRIEESLYDIPAPPKMVSLLFTLLESLSIRENFTPVQRIGLPVDPCDCSRNLAHMALFPHDERMVDLVGEESYVRWMDDQNFGAGSRAEGLRILASVGESLRRLHLTPNSGKSEILSLREAKTHFHFSANQDLATIDTLPFRTERERRVLRKHIQEAWTLAIRNEGKGEWQKILKRFYRYAARGRTRMFTRRAKKDLLMFPALVDRIGDYMRYVLAVSEYLDFVSGVLDETQQVYPDISFQLIESLLKLEPAPPEKIRLRRLAQGIYASSLSFTGRDGCKPLVPLLYLRFGDKRNIRGLAGSVGTRLDSLPVTVTRSICAVLASCGNTEFDIVKSAASRLLRNHLSEFVKMVGRIQGFTRVEGRFKARIVVSRDSITGAKFIDMRSLLAARLLGLCSHPSVTSWLASKRTTLLADDLSDFDKKLIRRLWP